MAPCMKSAAVIIALSTCSIFASFYLINLINKKRKVRRENAAFDKDLQFHSLDGAPDSKSVDDPDILSVSVARFLTEALSGYQTNLFYKEKALVTIVNKAAFSRNHAVLRDVGCLQKLLGLIQSYRLSQIAGGVLSWDSKGMPVVVSLGSNQPVVLTNQDAKLLQTALRAVNNLAMNDENQTILQDCIPNLLYLTMVDSFDQDVRLAAAEALTNLSVTSAYHALYAIDIDPLTDCLVSKNDKRLRLQILRILVNLSDNVAMASCLWNSKLKFLTLLELEDESLQTRWLTALKKTVSNFTDFEYGDVNKECAQLMPVFETMFNIPGEVGTLARAVSEELTVTVQAFIISKT